MRCRNRPNQPRELISYNKLYELGQNVLSTGKDILQRPCVFVGPLSLLQNSSEWI